jgi:hypothetical protein
MGQHRSGQPGSSARNAGKATVAFHDYHDNDELPGVLASSMARPAPGYSWAIRSPFASPDWRSPPGMGRAHGRGHRGRSLLRLSGSGGLLGGLFERC